jgi:crotonobetainyl-CoA:carnitine CoA-transferase CaiB-like acyl-CoA transferase
MLNLEGQNMSKEQHGTGALSGIRVVDFSRVAAGPYCTMLLGDLGAEIIKVEQPDRGDDSRGWPPFVKGESTYFLGVNRNKKSVCLDLRNEEDREVACKLVMECDVVVENFRPGTMERFGLSYETLSQRHQGLIYCGISAYGQEGPYKDRAGYDLAVSAIGGLMGITGMPGGAPVKSGVALLDIMTGLYAFSGILAALYHREHTGQGQRLDVSLLSTQLATLLNAASAYLLTGEIPHPQGNAHESVVPYQAFRASDGYILIAVANDKLFPQLCQALGQPEWAADPRFHTNADRVQHREVLVPMIEAIIQIDTVAAWEQRLAAANVAVAPINRMDQVFRHPQVEHSQQVATLTHPTVGEMKVVGPAVTYSLTPAQVTMPPPRLGEHTEEVINAILNEEKNR